jgi:Tfp pilus assembly pilus retraction ATPase PilT
VTIEDSAELQIQGVANLVKLEARNANVEGIGEISIRSLLKTSLRMRPDRIIVGEVRGGESIDMLQSLNTGHCGASTGHANSPEDMLSRLEMMVLMGMEIPLEAVRRQIASAIDVIVHLGRMQDGSRKVLKVVEILGVKNGEILAELPLEIAGLMSDKPLAQVNELLENAKEAAYTLGVGKDIDPFMTLSFMSLPVIPTLRLTTRGVVDVMTQQYI